MDTKKKGIVVKVFISWSGKDGQRLAEILRRTIPSVIQSAQPWVSAEDIGAGRAWNDDLRQAMEDADAAIICVTHAKESQWQMFEAGALMCGSGRRPVIPLVLKGKLKSLPPPLRQFQVVRCDRRGLLELFKGLNKRRVPQPIAETVLYRMFQAEWPFLWEALHKLRGGFDTREAPLAAVHPYSGNWCFRGTCRVPEGQSAQEVESVTWSGDLDLFVSASRALFSGTLHSELRLEGGETPGTVYTAARLRTLKMTAGQVTLEFDQRLADWLSAAPAGERAEGVVQRIQLELKPRPEDYLTRLSGTFSLEGTLGVYEGKVRFRKA